MYRLSALLALLWASPLLAAADDPYRVTVDLAPSIRLLGNDDPVVRDPAETLIEALGPDALPALGAALQREDEAVRLGIVEVLGLMDGDAVRDLLVERADEDRSADVRAAALSALTGFDDERVSALVSAALASDDPRLYRVAVDGCGARCASDGELDRLVSLAFSEPASFASSPRAALARVASVPEQRAAVVGAVERGAVARLDDGEPEQRLRAALLLADLGDARAREPLALAFEEGVPTMLRVQALVALGSAGDAETVTQLGGALDSLPAAIRPAGCKGLILLAQRDVEGAADEARTRGCAGLR